MKTIIGLDEKYDRKNEKRRVGRRNEEGLTSILNYMILINLDKD